MMAMHPFNLKVIDASWLACIERGIDHIDPSYLQTLTTSPHWLPGSHKIFNAFSLPLEKVNYVLFGESPYPRAESANGYAFWDAQVKELWSETGLSKKVNRATSLRNILKMLLLAEKLLNKNDLTQAAIARIDKTPLVKTGEALFKRFIASGFLLLNATPVLQVNSPEKDAKAWYPFMENLLQCLLEKNPHVQFVLFGKIANKIEPLIKDHPQVKKLCAEHPYNHSFITNEAVINFFKPLHLLIENP